MLKKCILYSLLINSLIQCSDNSDSALERVKDGIESRQNLNMILNGFKDTYLKEPSLAEKHERVFNQLNDQAQPFISTIPQLQEQVESFQQSGSLKILAMLMLQTVKDYRDITTITSDVCNLGKILHAEWMLKFHSKSKV